MSVRTNFETEIQELKDELLTLSSIVEQQILNAVSALMKRDIEGSEKIKETDNKVNQIRFAIEERVLVSIATQQPLAHDLRLLASILEIAGELERIGDYAKGIATINIRMGDETLLKPYAKIPPMADKAVEMLHRSLTAFVNEDVEEARNIPDEDDVVDKYYEEIYTDLMKIIIEDPTTMQKTNWLIWTAHNLERMADRVTNICERTLFTATGVLRELRSTEQ
ncbi:MAG: phosphate transport system regulatory protein PhoU [Chloroflexi bacterium HGW-Chloroflexi-5]|jgi:phosphate transport system protein|nr:MAG: phosphate transport system regulatory protein PhoU [Chloroflexi bacterium HGW-Chloroflexi-5]